MKNRAFTLIELLVVVLIIGILAAIAVPKYQRAVDKSRFAQLRLTTRDIFNAQKAYYLANGEYASDLKNLDISYPQNAYEGKNLINFKWGQCNCLGEGGVAHCWLLNPRVNYYIWPTESIQCAAETSSERAMDLCRQELPGANETYYASGYCGFPCTIFLK